jgi:autophagy-related protein 5
MDCTSEDPFKHIPIRLYQSDRPFVQKLVKPLTEPGANGAKSTEIATLGDALAQLAPEAPQPHKVIIQGLEPPLYTPLHYLSEHLSYPDNFLHVVLRPC